jgi:hypothetical protein
METSTTVIEEPQRTTQPQPRRQKRPPKPPVTTATQIADPREDPAGRKDAEMANEEPRRIAVIATIYKHLSHAQHFADRFMVGYPREGEWHMPNTRVVSLFVDQKPAGDQSADRAREFGFQVYPTIAEALRCGGDKLAVDAVLIIAEHGEYPDNEKGQKQYPRYEFFKQCVEVFDADSRAVPVYNDKHLSTSFPKAREMLADAARLHFPVLAGSSIPVTWRLPDLELPLGCEIEEAVMVGIGGSDSHDFHALEGLQCMVERRKGGETGVSSVEMIEGDAVWKAMDAGRWSNELLDSALSRSDSPCGLTVEDGRTQDLLGNGELPRLVEKPSAYFISYSDGLKATLLMLNGAVRDFNFAARLRGQERPQSCQFFLTPTPNVTYSACLVARIEDMIMTGKAPFPAQRTLLAGGILESCLESRLQGHKLLETPHLDVRYSAPEKSQHAHS